MPLGVHDRAGGRSSCQWTACFHQAHGNTFTNLKTQLPKCMRSHQPTHAPRGAHQPTHSPCGSHQPTLAPCCAQPEEELVEGEEGELDADVGASLTASVTKGDTSLV